MLLLLILFTVFACLIILFDAHTDRMESQWLMNLEHKYFINENKENQ